MPVSFSEWTLSGSRTCFYIKVRPLTSGVVHNFHKNQGILSSNLWVKSYPLKRVSSESFNLNNFFFLKSTFCHSLLGKYLIKKKNYFKFAKSKLWVKQQDYCFVRVLIFIFLHFWVQFRNERAQTLLSTNPFNCRCLGVNEFIKSVLAFQLYKYSKC